MRTVPITDALHEYFPPESPIHEEYAASIACSDNNNNNSDENGDDEVEDPEVVLRRAATEIYIKLKIVCDKYDAHKKSKKRKRDEDD